MTITGLNRRERVEFRGMTEELNTICKQFGVSVSEVLSASRFKTVVAARHFFWSKCRDKLFSYPEIGWITGHDHSTVMAALKKKYPVQFSPDLGGAAST